MAHIGDELLPQMFHLAQLPAGIVQGVGQLGDLPVGAAGKLRAVIAGGQLLGAFGNAGDGTGDHGGKQQHQQDGKRRHDDRDDDQLGPQCFHRGIDGRDGGIHHDHDRLGAFVLSARGQNAVQQLLGGGGLGGCFALHGGGKLQELIVFQHGAAVFLRLPEQQRRLIGKQHVQDAGGLVAGGQYRGAVLPHDVDTDEILAGQTVHLGVKVLIIDAGGYFLGGIFNGAGLDGFVEALQKDDLQKPQQHQQQRHEHSKAAHQSPADAQVGKTALLMLRGRGGLSWRLRLHRFPALPQFQSGTQLLLA